MHKYVDVVVIGCFLLGVVLMLRRYQKKEEAISELKALFLFSIHVFTGVVIATASGDKDAIKEWSEDQIKRLNRSKNYLPKKPGAWYSLAKEALYNKASDRFDTAMKLIEQKHYSQALDVLVISNKEIMEYEVIKR